MHGYALMCKWKGAQRPAGRYPHLISDSRTIQEMDQSISKAAACSSSRSCSVTFELMTALMRLVLGLDCATMVVLLDLLAKASSCSDAADGLLSVFGLFSPDK